MGAGNDIEIPTFSIDIEIQKDVSIDIEISIYDPVTNLPVLKKKCKFYKVQKSQNMLHFFFVYVYERIHPQNKLINFFKFYDFA